MLRPYRSGAATGDAADGRGAVISQRAAGSRPWCGENHGGGAASLERVYFLNFYHKEWQTFKTAKYDEHSVLITQFQQLSTHDQFCFIYVTILHSPSNILKQIPDIVTF